MNQGGTPGGAQRADHRAGRGAHHVVGRGTGWDPAEADYVVGTSAGSMIGALCASGVPPWFMVAHSRGEVFEGVVGADGRPAAEADRSGGARFQLERALPPIGPGSWRLALRTLANPRRFTPAAVFTGWIPRGIFSTEPLKDTIRRVVPSGWSPHPNLWVVACDYETGPPRPVRPRRRPRGRARRRRRRLLRDPRLLPPADDRRAPLRRRRHLLDLEPRPAARRGPRPRHLPQPDLLPAPVRAPTRASGSTRCGDASGRRLGSEAKSSAPPAPRSS